MTGPRHPIALHHAPGGLRLVHDRRPATAAAIFGLAVRAGSADESPATEGLAHLVEHTIFKGTARRRSWHIINRMEAVGGELNAYTTKEITVLYTVFPATALQRAVELVADLAINSTFPRAEPEKERQVVIDEINSYLDTPAEAIYDDFEDLLFAGTPLGHNILGTPGSVLSLDSSHCRDFLDRFYRRDNAVAFYSGPAGADRVLASIERHFVAMPEGRPPRAGSQPTAAPRFDICRSLPIHQCHCITGTGCPSLTHPGRHATALLANILGGPGLNSLLNLELRERRGLVYSVEASTALFENDGALSVYFGCDPEDLDRCRRICENTFSRLAEGYIDSRRLAAARKQYLGQLAIAAENSENRILAAARATLLRGKPTTETETIEAIHRITPHHIAGAAEALLKPSTLTFIPS